MLHGKAKVQLVVVSREARTRGRQKQTAEEATTAASATTEHMELFEQLKTLRKEIANENNYPAYVVMSDKSLHALATDMPTTLSAFGNTYGIGEHKCNTYGERFIGLIQQYVSAHQKSQTPDVSVTPETPAEPKEKKKKIKNQITIKGVCYNIDLDIWESIDWRKVLKEITTKAYWNYQNALEIPLSDYVVPGTEHQDRIIATLCQLLKEAYNMNVDEQTHKVIIPQKYDYDQYGQAVPFPTGSFYEILSRFRLFVIQNKRYPFMDGDRNEIELRKWFREVGHGLVALTDEQKILFDNLSTEFADMPRTRSQLEKKPSDV